MSVTDPVSAHPERAFQILDEPGVGVLVLDRDMQVTWVNAYVADILSTSEEEILGCDAPLVLDTHLVPLLREHESARDSSPRCVMGLRCRVLNSQCRTHGGRNSGLSIPARR